MGGSPEFKQFVENEVVPKRSDIAEQEITAKMQDNFLSNEKTAKMTYALSANEEKDVFTITLGTLSGKSSSIEVKGNHVAVNAVNTYLLQILRGDTIIGLPLSAFSGANQEELTSLEKLIAEATSKIMN